MLALKQVRQLRKFDGADVVAAHAPETRRRFSTDEGIPVLIAARNEESDLPATLLTLSWSSVPVSPYVIVNGTTDATAERAERMGACVLESTQSFKMAALQHGVATLRERRGGRGPILFTDADTLVGLEWAAVMARTCRAWSRPVVTLGNSVFTHGESGTADMLRSVRKVMVAEVRDRRGQRALAHGHNMAIDFADSAEAFSAYLDIDPARFIGEEEEIVERLLDVGGEWRPALGSKTLVITRGDRFVLSDLWQLRSDHTFEQRRQRYAEYGEIKPFIRAEDPASTEMVSPTRIDDTLSSGRRVS
ncbi:hypothetical protein [Austwickia chelonae]|uniref:hypothetical protein n=1 Tax=Austwickia chelonae TaxID=100225 RepID=UPI000E250049|nr:hypothetical protein [Austwickia chelonae]